VGKGISTISGGSVSIGDQDRVVQRSAQGLGFLQRAAPADQPEPGAVLTALHGRKRRTIKRSSSEDRLTFNAGLMKEPAPLRAQVIVYELLHLNFPNHGMVFKALSNAYLADHTGKT
jgi:hypothetical protein